MDSIIEHNKQENILIKNGKEITKNNEFLNNLKTVLKYYMRVHPQQENLGVIHMQ